MESYAEVSKGKKSVEKFLNPGKHPMLPLVEIPESLNPFADHGVKIFAKLMTFSPLGNVKALPAYNMMQSLYQRAELDQIENVVENSSGNTVFSIALAAQQFGVQNTSSYVLHEISIHKLWMLLYFGVKPIVNLEPPLPDGNDPRAGVYKARETGSQPGWINPGQYDNPDNPAAHEKWTAKQIWKQTKGKIDILCAGLGTTGTITGTACALKKKNDAINIVGAMREDSSYVPGVRTKGLLDLIGFDWEQEVDFIEKVNTVESYRRSMQLSRQGIVVGPVQVLLSVDY